MLTAHIRTINNSKQPQGKGEGVRKNHACVYVCVCRMYLASKLNRFFHFCQSNLGRLQHKKRARCKVFKKSTLTAMPPVTATATSTALLQLQLLVGIAIVTLDSAQWGGRERAVHCTSLCSSKRLCPFSASPYLLPPPFLTLCLFLHCHAKVVMK